MEQPKSGNVRSDINVTPLVDVVLVLLIIFMVVTPMLQKGAAVVLPITNNPPKKPDEKDQIIVAVTDQKRAWIDKDGPLTLDAFPAKMKETFERNPGSTVVIKGDARLTYGDVKKVMMQVKDAGYGSVGLITSKRSTEK